MGWSELNEYIDHWQTSHGARGEADKIAGGKKEERAL